MAFEIPPSNFHFQLDFGEGYSSQDAIFKEVSGLNISMETKEVTEGGQNTPTYHLPVRTKYEELVLSRGFVYQNSDLGQWVSETLEGSIQDKIEPRNIYLQLLDETGTPLSSWTFEKAYPVKWEISGVNGMQGEIVIEKISFRYLFFKRTK